MAPPNAVSRRHARLTREQTPRLPTPSGLRQAKGLGVACFCGDWDSVCGAVLIVLKKWSKIPDPARF
jgi:hypothetical protein